MRSVKAIINQWDPADLLMHAPENEYHSEIEAIESFVATCSDIIALAEYIHTLFLRAFGPDVFTASPKECEEIARKIVSTE